MPTAEALKPDLPIADCHLGFNDAFRFGPPRQKGVSFIRARWHDFRRYPDRHMTSTMRDALAPCASEADLDRSFVWMRSCSPA
ncbi:hypothetical protein ABTM18_19560, partial [Acinetobacter baumannii]